jgi:ethanolamine utilization cobalamin adenosyltransferase
LAQVRIDRKQKNIMRSQLEKVLEMQKIIDRKIDDFHKETEVAEYQQFWQELKNSNTETMQRLSRFMVRKCNR